ncbi:hypothetical protein, partial [Pseudomonas carnis]|uniref:hypothetical protein n=1 Tax=Pseudomonas carnis TaxID=2487355 RepID=UPI001F1578A0
SQTPQQQHRTQQQEGGRRRKLVIETRLVTDKTCGAGWVLCLFPADTTDSDTPNNAQRISFSVISFFIALLSKHSKIIALGCK